MTPDFLSMPTRGYLDALASGDPTPGGGSAAGLTGAMAAALLAMSARFTIGRPKYADYAPVATAVLDRAEAARAALQRLMEEDSAAYAAYGAALALPKETEAEKVARRTAIQQATKASAAVPMVIARQCAALLDDAVLLAANCNPYLVSDVVVATHLALSAFRSAAVNVRINLASLTDTAFVQQMGGELDALSAQAPAQAHAALVTAYGVMNLPLEGVGA